MVNNDYNKFRSFSRLYMTFFRHRTCIYLHGRADRFLVLVSNVQVAALSDWAYYQYALITHIPALAVYCNRLKAVGWGSDTIIASSRETCRAGFISYAGLGARCV